MIRKDIFDCTQKQKSNNYFMLNFNMILCILKKILLLSIMPFAMYAMDPDDQSDVLKLPDASANGATVIVQDEQADAPVEPNPKTTDIDTAPIH
jgi:hypothetical protein